MLHGFCNLASPLLLELRGLTKLCLSSPFMGHGAEGWVVPGGTDCLPTSLRHLELDDQMWGLLTEWDKAAQLQCMLPLSRLTGLTHLSLTGTGVALDAPMLECLAPLQQLEELDVFDYISLPTLAPLASLRRLTFLHMSLGSALDFDAALPVLSRMKALHLCPVSPRKDLHSLLARLPPTVNACIM